MARWRSVPGRLEAPEWYRNYHPEDWDEMDAQELRMYHGRIGMDPWPPDLHGIHAHRRWEQARHRYRQENPAFGEQEFEDMMEEIRRS